MHKTNSKGFTLLELLIVISIIAILSVIVILVLNPSEMLKKARDSQRMADLNTMKTAIGLYITGTNTPMLGRNNSQTGCGTTVWYSRIGASGSVNGGDTASSSPNVGDIGKIDGSGWVPVNLATLTGGSPISNWPIDPINSSDGTLSENDLVYRYTCDATTMQFEINATLESAAYTTVDDKDGVDGGDNAALYETGTNLLLLNSTL